AGHPGHGEPRPVAGRPAQGACRRARGEGGLVPLRAGRARVAAALLPRGPLEPAGRSPADASGRGRLADGRCERPAPDSLLADAARLTVTAEADRTREAVWESEGGHGAGASVTSPWLRVAVATPEDRPERV